MRAGRAGAACLSGPSSCRHHLQRALSPPAGLQNYVISLAAVLYFGFYRRSLPLGWVYDNYVPLITASIIFSGVLSLYLYASRCAPLPPGVAVGQRAWCPLAQRLPAERSASLVLPRMQGRDARPWGSLSSGSKRGVQCCVVLLADRRCPPGLWPSPHAQPLPHAPVLLPQLCQGRPAGQGRQHRLPPVRLLHRPRAEPAAGQPRPERVLRADAGCVGGPLWVGTPLWVGRPVWVGRSLLATAVHHSCAATVEVADYEPKARAPRELCPSVPGKWAQGSARHHIKGLEAPQRFTRVGCLLQRSTAIHSASRLPTFPLVCPQASLAGS